MELLWLGEDHDLQSALKVAEKAKNGYGLAQKGPSNALRFAVRFRKLEDLLQYAKDVGLEESAQLGRFKLSGVNVGIGAHGILAFLVEQRWTAVEVLYVGEHHAVFLAGGIGSYGPMNYIFPGALRQLQFTALNAQAKHMIKSLHTTNAAPASASTSSVPGRAASRKQFFDDLNIQHVLHQRDPPSPAKKPDKRGQISPTGVTPESKAIKDK